MKMVLSDLDGTLLKKGETALSLETFDMIHMLAQRGKLFAVASGRTYHELHTLFAPVAEMMLFVCLDGALVVRGGETLFSTPVPPEISVQLWRQSMEKEEGVLLLCGKERTYFWTAAPSMAREVRDKYGCHAVPFDNPAEIDEPVYKLMYRGAPLKADPKQLSQVYCGSGWQEWVMPGVDKGAATVLLQQKYRIPATECMAFGDGDNDIALLRQVGSRFAVGDASPHVRAMCDRRTERVEQIVMAYLADNRRLK